MQKGGHWSDTASERQDRDWQVLQCKCRVPWGETLLSLAPTGEEVDPQTGHILTRGLSAKVGIFHGPITRLCPHAVTGQPPSTSMAPPQPASAGLVLGFSLFSMSPLLDHRYHLFASHLYSFHHTCTCTYVTAWPFSEPCMYRPTQQNLWGLSLVMFSRHTQL